MSINVYRNFYSQTLKISKTSTNSKTLIEQLKTLIKEFKYVIRKVKRKIKFKMVKIFVVQYIKIIHFKIRRIEAEA